MSHQTVFPAGPAGADPGHQLAQLRDAQRLVARFAGRTPSGDAERGLDEAARVSVAYQRALPVQQRRFDVLAAETAGWAAAGIEALALAEETGPATAAAAARLADRLDAAIAALARAVG